MNGGVVCTYKGHGAPIPTLPGLLPASRSINSTRPPFHSSPHPPSLLSFLTVCEPRSIGPVVQQPSRVKPVMGSVPQS